MVNNIKFMTQKLIVFLLITIFAVSCGEKKKVEPPLVVDGKILKKMVEEALWGSKKSNINLSGLVRADTPSPKEANRIIIDSTDYKISNKLYTVLIEYPDPQYNILAVYDKNLVLYLQDNSLNGNIVTDWRTLSNKLYLVASEDFLAKDFLKLSRISLYTFIDTKLDLVFRAFTKYDKADETYLQKVETIDDNKITTLITVNKKSKLNNVTDTFNFDTMESKYISTQNILNEFIMSEISKADWKLEKPELTQKVIDEQKNGSENLSKDQPEKRTTTKTENAADPEGFQISLNSDWSAPVASAVSEYLITQLDGFKYVNQKLGSEIYIIPLPEGSSSAQFVKYKFGKPTHGDYQVRQTELIYSGYKQIQFFEHSCDAKSYLLLLVIPQDTFDSNKKLYNGIINSFFIEC